MDHTVSMWMLTVLLAALTTRIGGRQRKARRQAGKRAGAQKGPARKGPDSQPQIMTQLQLIRQDIPRAPRQVTTRLVKWARPRTFSGDVADVFFSEAFTLDQLQENGAMRIMWAEYKIVEIERTFRPMYRANSIIDGPAMGPIPMIYVIYSPDQSFSVSAITDFQRYAGVVITDDARPFTVKCKPRVALSVYDGIITSAYTVAPPSWMQTSEPSIPHFGMHTAITGNGILAGPFQIWNVETRYIVDFRIVR